MHAMRKAGEGLMTNPYFNAAAEALLTAGIIAVPQTMSGEADIDLAIGVLAGLGAAVPGSIIGNKAGRLAGRQIDRYYHSSPERLNSVNSIPGPIYNTYHGAMNVLVPGSRDNVQALSAMIDNPKVPEQLREAAKPVLAINKQRHAAFNTQKDGTVLDPLLNGMESDLGMLGQKYGDNVGQLIAQLAVAKALNGEAEEAQ